MPKSIAHWLAPRVGEAPSASVFVRVATGLVFIAAGIVKLAYANQGVERFAKIALPAPAVLAPFVSTVEIVAGALLVVGLLTRLAAVPLVIDMVVAIATTKLPLLFGPGPEPIGAMPKVGLLAFAYQARLDAAMLCSCVYLAAVGSGLISLDAILARRRWEGALDDAVGNTGESPSEA